MPTRYLKPGIRDSELIDGLSAEAEVLFYRLLVTVDDFGRADARPSMVKAACFPIKDAATQAKCEKWLAELASAGLVDVYSVGGKPYLQVRKWDNTPRAKESKYPPIPAENARTYTYVCNPRTHVCNPRTLLPVTVTVTETETVVAGATARGARLPAGWVPSEDLLRWTRSEKPGVDHLPMLERFRDYWTAQPGQKGVKTDWDATWRNWVRREIPPAGGLPANGQRFVPV